MATVFVFGSNLKGIHGSGAALTALRVWGAVQGCGEGRRGESYALPTKRTPYEKLPLVEITCYVDDFLVYASRNPQDAFLLTKVGCGRAGYSEEDISPLFRAAPLNVHLLNEDGTIRCLAREWGTRGN